MTTDRTQRTTAPTDRSHEDLNAVTQSPTSSVYSNEPFTHMAPISTQSPERRNAHC